MRFLYRIIITLVAVTLIVLCANSVTIAQPFAQRSHSGIVWNTYFISEQLAIGKLGVNKEDSNNYAQRSAWLELGKDSTSKGVIFPRVVDTFIISPAKGLVIYRLIDSSIYVYTGLKWNKVGSSGGGTISAPDTTIYRTVLNSYTKAQVDAKDAVKLNIADTTNKWLPIGYVQDTTGLSNRINQRVKYTDTSLMLANYINYVTYGLIKSSQSVRVDSSLIRTVANSYTKAQVDVLIAAAARADSTIAGYALTETSNRLDVDTIVLKVTFYNKPQVDALVSSASHIDSTTAAYGLIETANALRVDTSLIRTVLNSYNKSQIDAFIAGTVKYTDTAAMLAPYLRSAVAAATYATIAQLNAKLNITDTTGKWLSSATVFDPSSTNEIQTFPQTLALDSVGTHQLLIRNTFSTLGALIRGSGTSFSVGIGSSSAGGFIQGYAGTASATRTLFLQPSGSTTRVGIGIDNGATLQSSGRLTIDSLNTGVGTDSVLVYNKEVKRVSARQLTDPIVTTSTSTNLSVTTLSDYWIYRGSNPALWILPTPVANKRILIGNKASSGAAQLTVQSATGQQIFLQGASQTAIPMNSGETYEFVSDGTFWYVF